MPSQDPQNPEQPAEPKPPSKLKQLWTKLGLDPMTLKLMLKGSIPPTIAIAMYQSPAVAAQYSTIGFLVAITSILGFAIMPRGKFLQTMSLNILATGLAAAVNLLALYCITQARLHTTPAGQPLSGYSSSASVVCAVWLSVQFPNMAAAISFMQKLLEAFLTGFALATGTNLFIFPTSARSVVFKEMTGYLMCLSGMLKAQTAYMQSMETIDPIALRHQREEEQRESEQDGTKKKARKPAVPLSSPLATPASLKLKEVLGKTVELHTKLHGDVTPAKREFAIGKLESHDLTERNKLIFPGSKTLYKWFRAVFGREDLSNDGSYLAEMDSGGAEATYLGEDFMRRKDPEHLPPRNAFERMGESVRKLPRFFRSDESAFGFRVVCATMTIAITCYLEASQAWFLRQRLLWAMIMVAISMSRTAGQSTFNFSLRIFGTLVAMLGSYIIWYIVDGHAAGAIVFLWLWMCCAYYVILKFPKLIIVAILSLVTAVLIIGYELQVQVLGVKVSESNGQPAYPTYELAPYRLACVAGGLLVAFIWTIFPFPISESTELRKDIGASLYLLSNFYSIVHETVRTRITGTDGDVKVKGTHAYHLEKARDAVFSKSMLLLNNLKTNSQFSKFQLRIGGRFPAAEYEGLIESCQRVLQYTALMSHASLTFSTHNKADATEESQWARDFRQLVSQTSTTSHKVTSLLALLSTSMSYGQPLPPYLEMPQPFQFVKKVDSIDPDLLSIRHIAEPEYSAFAVIQVCSQAVHADLEKLK
ncbi:hypothetical protein LTR32_001224, partial [Rachicladosporium monterosium]